MGHIDPWVGGTHSQGGESIFFFKKTKTTITLTIL